MSGIRPEVVAGVLANDPAALANATWAEQQAAVRQRVLWQLEDVFGKARAHGVRVLPGVPSLVEWDLHRLRHLAAQGAAIAAIADRLGPTWNPHPEMKMLDVLKTQPPEVVAEVAARLAEVDIHDLDGLVPDLPNLGS